MRDGDALTADEVAGLLQVSRSTVYKLVKKDELASYYVGRKMRFTMGDVENYIARAKRRSMLGSKLASIRPPQAQGDDRARPPAPGLAATAQRPGQGRHGGPRAERFVIAGNDVVGDLMANYLSAADVGVERVYEGSYDALVDVYRGHAHAALVHLPDAEGGGYNIDMAKRLLPGMPMRILRLVRRRQGLVVAKGNPKGLRTWDDLLAPGLRLINRERGCGSRILLDEQLSQRGADRSALGGYGREANSALSMASFVARGAADVGIGAERVYHQVEGLDFLPLQDEWLDVVLVRRPEFERAADALTRLLRARPFREEVGLIVGYDASRMGEVVFER